MNISMQALEAMTEQERLDWFEDIPEQELLAQLDAMAEPERLTLHIRKHAPAITQVGPRLPILAALAENTGSSTKIGWKPTARRNFGSWSARANWQPSAKRKTWKSETSLRTL